MSLPLTAVIGGATGRRTGSSPPGFTLPAALQNLDLLVYGDRLAGTYAIGDPMPTIGEPPVNALSASAEATLQQTAGGKSFASFSGDDAYSLPSIAQSGTNATMFVMGRNWTTPTNSNFSLWGSAGFNIVIQKVAPAQGHARAIINKNGATSAFISGIDPGAGWFFWAVRISPSGELLVWYNGAELIRDANFGFIDTLDVPLRFMANGGNTGFRGAGEIHIAAYTREALPDSRLLDIWNLRPTS